jgi:hypothetical protein
MRSFLSVVLLLTGVGLGVVHAQEPVGTSAGLRAKYDALQPQLKQNAFGKPLVLQSAEAKDRVAGDIYAVVRAPFDQAAPALAQAQSWCDILLLQFNIKQCGAAAKNDGALLDVRIGRKFDQPVDQAYKVAFAYRVASRSKDYVQLRLAADEGPVSTKDYRIMLEAAPLADGASFIHLSYSYGFGFAGRMAMQAYLGTSGSGKVGFTAAGKGADGQPELVGGMRGVVERNTMRYYLAIESFLGALGAPPAQRFEKASRDWFAGTERYKRQLHEMDEAQYLAMKKKEYERQAAANQGGNAPTGSGS